MKRSSVRSQIIVIRDQLVYNVKKTTIAIHEIYEEASIQHNCFYYLNWMYDIMDKYKPHIGWWKEVPLFLFIKFCIKMYIYIIIHNYLWYRNKKSRFYYTIYCSEIYKVL